MKSKLKILSSITSLAVVTTATPLLATACTTTKLNDVKEKVNDLDINTLGWVKRTSFTTTDNDKITAIVKQDNEVLFSNYENLESAISITSSIDGDILTIKITASSSGYSGLVQWDAKYEGEVIPPSERPNLADLIWVTRNSYTSNVVDTIKQTITTDNANVFTRWSDVSFNVDVSNNFISVNIYVVKNTHYEGNVRWTAYYEPIKTDLARYSWRTRANYNANSEANIIAAVKNDNSSIFTDWNNVTLNVSFFESLHIGIIIGTANSTKYSGTMSWSATYTPCENPVFVVDYASNLTYTTTNGNGTLGWYRIYSDGWIEQGGYCNIPGETLTITFPKAFKNTNYNIYCGPSMSSANQLCYANRSTAQKAVLDYYGSGTGGAYWWACGF